ncbi:methionyl-tRNA formyltransferase [bacterium]|nr:MAG: methionyl-tRNA formyltransferase [bacterium]
MKIIFMGTPRFAVPSLNALLNAGHEIACVITQPDKPSGRGRGEAEPPIKTAARLAGIRVIQPASLKDVNLTAQVRGFGAELIAVVAYGKILPEAMLNIPPKGCVNLHASLLPKYRGAAPINRAIINGDTQTGVCTMLMDKGMDTGAVFLTEKTDIGAEETAGELSARLAEIGAKLLSKTIGLIEKSGITAIPQNEKEASYATPLKKEDGKIDWQKPSIKIHCLMRGASPWPGAYAYLNGERIKIYSGKALTEAVPSKLTPGLVITAGPDSVKVMCGDGIFEILELQAEGKRRLSARDFLKGFRISAGDTFQ